MSASGKGGTGGQGQRGLGYKHPFSKDLPGHPGCAQSHALLLGQAAGRAAGAGFKELRSLVSASAGSCLNFQLHQPTVIRKVPCYCLMT